VIVDAVGELHPYQGHVTEIAGTAVQRAGEQVQVFPVKVALDDPDDRLRPGMTAKARIEAARADDAVTVPIQAVLLKSKVEVEKELADRGRKAAKRGAKKESEEPAQPVEPATNTEPAAAASVAESGATTGKDGKLEVVYKVVDGKAVLTKVKSGLSDETTVAVLEGLAEGDQVVTGPYRTVKKLKDGQPVRAKKGGGEDKEGESAAKEGEAAKDEAE
jgi:HlyD family secretion protein